MTILVTWTPTDIGARDAELVADPFAFIDTNGTVVGADPLATNDGDTSYVELTDSTQGTTFQLTPDRAVPTGALLELWWEATYRVVGSPPTFGNDYRIWVNGPDIRGGFGDEDAPARPTSYTSIEWFHLTPAYNGDAAEMLQAAVDQPETLYGLTGPTGGTVRVTFLRMFSLHEGDDAAPLRIFQRGDSLGAGSGRILGAGTRQSSSKVFGAL